jgi:dephospho-CoA kinase
MIVIGLTGGIGSGKTIVAGLLQVYGVPVYDSDTRAKALCNTDEELKAGLIGLFGPELYRDGLMDRTWMADRVFENPEALKAANALIHPVVGRDFIFWANQQGTPVVAQETAILFEAGLEKRFDKIICVTAPEELRIKRTCQRSGLSPEEVRVRISNQLSEEERINRSDVVIVNDGVCPLIPQVERFIQSLGVDEKLPEIIDIFI